MIKVSAFGKGILALAALTLPAVLPAATVHYKAVIQVQSSGGSLGYIAPDPNYWTPLLTADQNSALVVEFTLNGSTGTVSLSENDGRGPYFGAVQGRDSTSDDIAAGSFNYLYLDPISTTTAINATPQHVASYFSTSSGLAKTAETAIWNVDVNALTLAPQWVNTNGSKPATVVFVQSNHVYSGGDAGSFHSRFPAPVTTVTLHLVITVSQIVDSSDLTVSKTHTGKFLKGQGAGGTYTITVSNAGLAATTGSVMVVDMLPAGLTGSAISGTGWACTLATLICTRSDVLNAAASFPPISLIVDIGSNAPSTVTNQASVSGGGEIDTTNDSAADVTSIVSGTDVSSQVKVTQTGFGRNRATGLWTATMTVANVSPSVVQGPVQVVLTNLTPGVTMANNSGMLNGAPYITVAPGGLSVGGSVNVLIEFANPGNGFISFAPKVYSGVF